MSISISQPTYQTRPDAIKRHSITLAMLSDVRRPPKKTDGEIKQSALEDLLLSSPQNKLKVGTKPDTDVTPNVTPHPKPATRRASESSLDSSLLQMRTSRNVGNSPTTQIIAESLNIIADNTPTNGSIIVAEKVPSVADIPAPSIIDSEISEIKSYEAAVENKVDAGPIVEDDEIVPDAGASPVEQDEGITLQEPSSSMKLSKLATLTANEAKDIMSFINDKIAQRNSYPGSPTENTPNKIEEHHVESGSDTGEYHNVNNLNAVKPDKSKPKLSFLNKLKRSFKNCGSDKGKTNIPQLHRPPSTYLSTGSQISLNPDGSLHGSLHGSIQEKPQTPVLELLAKNPEMCSTNSVDKLNNMRSPHPTDVRAVMSDPDLAGRSSGTGRSRSLTEVTPIPPNGDVDLDASINAPSPTAYANDSDLRQENISLTSPVQLRIHDADSGDDKPRKRLSFVGKLKRKFSFGKGDKPEKKREISKSVPALASCADAKTTTSCSLPHIARSHSADNLSTTSSSVTDVRTQIVVRSAKINKGCKCQVCTLVRRNIRAHGNTDPNKRHKYEIVLKMNQLGADFLNSECCSVASYQGYEVPIVGGGIELEGGVDGTKPELSGSIKSVHSTHSNQLRTRTQSEIEDIVKDFNEDTHSTSSSSSSNSSSDTENDVADITSGALTPNNDSRQSAV